VELLIAAWKQILKDGEIPWVLFQLGTCVLLPDSQDNLEEQARDLLKQWGPAKAGTPANNFGLSLLDKSPKGFLVSCHHPDILTYVSQEESCNLGLIDGLRLHIGTLGRQKRAQDAQLLKVIHVEDLNGLT